MADEVEKSACDEGARNDSEVDDVLKEVHTMAVAKKKKAPAKKKATKKAAKKKK